MIVNKAREIVLRQYPHATYRYEPRDLTFTHTIYTRFITINDLSYAPKNEDEAWVDAALSIALQRPGSAGEALE